VATDGEGGVGESETDGGGSDRGGTATGTDDGQDDHETASERKEIEWIEEPTAPDGDDGHDP
jgi:hypothetical protein